MTTHIVECPRRGTAIVDVARGFKPPAQFPVKFSKHHAGMESSLYFSRWEWREMVREMRSEGCRVTCRGWVADKLIWNQKRDGSSSLEVEAWHDDRLIRVAASGNTKKQTEDNFWRNWNDASRTSRCHTHLAIAFHRKRDLVILH